MHARVLDAHQPCPSCLAERGERACPDCDAVIPATWARCWPCEPGLATPADAMRAPREGVVWARRA